MVTEPVTEARARSSFSEHYLANLAADESKYAHRSRKARKVAAALADYIQRRTDDGMGHYTCLDIGCATGTITGHLAQHFKRVVGIDLEHALLRQAQTEIADNPAANKIALAEADGSILPFAAASFDVVICAQVYEHAADPRQLVQEIWRVLRPGGICFFSGPNRLAIMEEHYWLPFLSWLPRPLAGGYMRLMQRGSVYDIGPMSYWGLRRLWRMFRITDYSVPMIRQPECFALEDQVDKRSWVKQIPPVLLRMAVPLLVPNFNWILEKPGP